MKCIVVSVLVYFMWNDVLLNFAQSLEAESIIGGETDWTNTYKYQVSIQAKSKRTNNYIHKCGGSIISEKFILTAAHCFVSKNGTILDPSNGYVRILAGTNRLNSEGIYRYIDKIYVNKNFSHSNPYKNGDITVIKLDEKLDVANDRRLAIIKLPKKLSYDAYVNKIATVSGFGVVNHESAIDENGKWVKIPVLPDIRQYIQGRIVPKDKCTPYDNIICTLLDKKNSFNIQGICSGDSGGPLIYRGTVIGIVSRASTTCDMRTKTAKFTLVSYYLDFIKRAVRQNSDKSDMVIVSNTSINKD